LLLRKKKLIEEKNIVNRKVFRKFYSSLIVLSLSMSFFFFVFFCCYKKSSKCNIERPKGRITSLKRILRRTDEKRKTTASNEKNAENADRFLIQQESQFR
tara:strand:+ start:2869 stop:3168 length:300 start_codon:yes stop_codon:yes gene_type:complete